MLPAIGRRLRAALFCAPARLPPAPGLRRTLIEKEMEKSVDFRTHFVYNRDKKRQSRSNNSI